MMKAGRVFNLVAIAGLICTVSILSACGAGDASNGNSSNSTAGPNSTAGANTNSTPAASSSPPAPQMESFTADSLIEALKKDRSAVDSRLSYQEISINGPVKVTDNHNVEFPGKDGGKVNCSATSFDKDVLQKLYEQGQAKGGSLPVATATGTYKMSMTPDSKPDKHWYVSLIQCRIEAPGK